MNYVNTFFIQISLVLAAISAVLNWVVVIMGPQYLRIRCAAVGVLSIFYSVSYAWILFNEEDMVTWTSFMRGASLLPWMVVWIYPALSYVKFNRNLELRIQELRDKIAMGIPLDQ